MGNESKKPKHTKRALSRQNTPRYFWTQFVAWWRLRLWHKAVVVLMAIVLFCVSSAYGIAEWYIFQNRNKPTVLGATFISDYAKQLGVDPQETLQAIISDLGVQHLRLVSYWNAIEKTPGAYNFDDLDWQFKMAEQAHIKVSLAIGLRQPRWPECHMPKWAAKQPKDLWSAELLTFMGKVIDRYHNSPVLQDYQLENEYFLSVFGDCPDFSRDRLVNEAKFVKAQDPTHPLTISRSNNAIGLPLGDPRPDQFGVSVYKRVWDKTVTKRYYEYPFPGWFYGFLAGAGKIMTGKDLIIHELQAEAWTPDGYNIVDAPVSELYKSMNPKRLHDRFQYAEASGIKQIDLWGVEWWYQMKVKRGESGLWNAARQEYAKTAAQNAKL